MGFLTVVAQQFGKNVLDAIEESSTYLVILEILSSFFVFLLMKFKYYNYEVFLNLRDLSLKKVSILEIIPKQQDSTLPKKQETIKDYYQVIKGFLRSSKFGKEEKQKLKQMYVYFADCVINFVFKIANKIYNILVESPLSVGWHPALLFLTCLFIVKIVIYFVFKKNLMTLIYLVIFVYVMWATGILDSYVVDTTIKTTLNLMKTILWDLIHEDL